MCIRDRSGSHIRQAIEDYYMTSPQIKANDDLAHSALLDANSEFGLNLNSEAQLEWLKDAGFGLFIHWSVDVQLGCVISHNLVGTSKDYQDRYFNELPKTFNPKQFDAEHIASLAKLMGVEYVVLTAKHHNGFCMWDTSTTDFSIMNMPYKRDIVKEFVDAVRGQGLKVGLYYSPEDFHFLYENDQPIQRGERREFSLKRLRATEKTSIRVLGITGERTEYAEGKIDIMPRFKQDGDTLTLSVANAQRIYCNGSKTWPNPLVVALTDVDVVTDK